MSKKFEVQVIANQSEDIIIETLGVKDDIKLGAGSGSPLVVEVTEQHTE
jgi:hypothetical protein